VKNLILHSLRPEKSRCKMSRYNWKSYSEAKKIVHKLELSGKKPYADWAKTKSRPKNIPASPVKVYKDEWVSWGDWLGTNTVATYNVKYCSFEEARKFVQKLNLSSRKKWEIYCKSGKKPNDIPFNPDNTYKNRKDSHGKQWKGWGDFLGTGNVAKKEFCSFEDARKFARKQKLENIEQWRMFAKSKKFPKDIPHSPEGTYKKEGKWKGWGDFLGTGYVAHFNRTYRSYEDSKKFVQKLKIQSIKEWQSFVKTNKLPDDIPHKPDHIYRKQGKWKGWGEFTGSGRVADMNKSKNWLPIKEAKIEARKIAKELGIKSELGWIRAWKAGKIPKNLPRELSTFYNPNRKRKKKK